MYGIIDIVLFGTWKQIYLQGFLYPIITSLVYVYAYPYPSKYVFEFSRNRQKELSDIKRKIEDETLLTAKKSRSIRRETYALEEEFQKDLEKDGYVKRDFNQSIRQHTYDLTHKGHSYLVENKYV